MSLKKRKILGVICCLLAAFCLYAGTKLRDGNPIFSTGGAAYETTYAGGIVGTDADGDQITMAPEQNPDRVRVWFGVALLVIGGVLSIFFLLLNRREGPLLGPDLEICLFLLFPYAPVAFNRIGGGLSVQVLSFLLLNSYLILLFNIVSWLRQKLPLDWLAVHRLSDFLRRRTKAFWLYPVTLSALCALGLGSSIWLPTVLYKRLGLPLGLTIVLAAGACLVRYFLNTDHLLRQIHTLRQGQTVKPQNGLFTEDETFLTEMLTQRDEAVRQAVADERFKVELIANVSHDLRTPLTAILGYSELLGKEPLSAEAAEWLAQLNQRAGYMRELVDSLFELTKISSGVLDANLENIDLIRLLEQTIGLMDDKLRQSGLEPRRRYCADTLPIRTDGSRMHQVFANLLENAVKYALPGTRIFLDVQEEAEAVNIRMTNTATYEMDFQPEEIVRRFARGDQARTTKGSGLGLAIAQTYTESVGGSFHVEIDGDQFRAVVTLPKSEND